MEHKQFKTTYLYIKQHKTTGLLYFGKSSRSIDEMLNYSGSGTYWKYHLNKHGYQIDTIWHMQFEDKNSCEEFATFFSEYHDIVNSKIWANLRVENGLNGGHDKGIPCKPEIKEKLSKAFKGRIGKNKGIKLKQSLCPHCGIKATTPNLNRWHLDKCTKKGNV